METPAKPGYVTGVPAPVTRVHGNRRKRLSARSDVPLSKKCSHFLSGFSQKSRRFLYLCNTAPRSLRFLTLEQPIADGQSSRTTASEATEGAARPAGRSRATFRSERPARPERPAGANCGPHSAAQPEAGACPRPGRPSAPPSGARGGPDCGAVRSSHSRWSA